MLLLMQIQEVTPQRSQPWFSISAPAQDIRIFWLDSKRTCGNNGALQPADYERLINIRHSVSVCHALCRKADESGRIFR